MPGSRLQRKKTQKKKQMKEKKGRPKKRWMTGVRRSMTNHGLTGGDNTDRDTWRNLVLDAGKPRYPGHSLDERKYNCDILIFMSFLLQTAMPTKKKSRIGQGIGIYNCYKHGQIVDGKQSWTHPSPRDPTRS